MIFCILGHILKDAGMGVIKINVTSNRLKDSKHNVQLEIIDSTRSFSNEENQLKTFD